ncbi:hypothetical protein CP533_4675 [Ophiocordyceps camponoti-saundersi (nom. inval.)]|nr:hypothetical protein CP533_4675 [Ophiocordyceps camponoti-saundersi (nom. inval.)]
MPQYHDQRLLDRAKSSEDTIPDEGLPALSFQPKRKGPCSSSIARQVTLHLFIVAIYLTAFFAFWDYKGCECRNRHKTGLYAYTPAWEALKWEPRVLENEIEIKNPFKGLPRPEMDEAWNKLLGPTAIRVSKEDLQKINRTSVPLQDGSGYMAGLDVYHQRYVRRYLHKDYYNMTQEKNMGQHIDHCLDSLRQYIMCNADLSIQTFDWIPNFHRPWPNFRIVHECANWEAIEEWAWAHHFDGFDQSLLRHPNFHPELPGPFDYSESGNDV